MKKLIVILLIITGCQLAASAQEKRDTIRGENKVAQRVKMKNELGLSKEQGKKMKELNEGFKTRLQAIKNDSTLTTEQRKEKNQVVLEERKQKVNEILTPDQQAKYRQLGKDNMKERKQKKGKGAKGKVEES